MRHLLFFLVVAIASVDCGRAAAPDSPVTEAADSRVRALADTYVAGFFDRFPEQVTYYGIAGRSHDRLTDNSLAAIQEWEKKEDAWLADVRGIDPASIVSGPLQATYAILREALESSVASRVCRSDLWNVS